MQISLIIHHILLLAFCLLIIMNRYLNRKKTNLVSLILNLVVTAVIVNIGLRYGIPRAIISILLYLMYMIILNIAVWRFIQKRDKSSDLLEELKKKINKQN